MCFCGRVSVSRVLIFLLFLFCFSLIDFICVLKSFKEFCVLKLLRKLKFFGISLCVGDEVGVDFDIKLGNYVWML